jgi:hypothetical protein
MQRGDPWERKKETRKARDLNPDKIILTPIITKY